MKHKGVKDAWLVDMKRKLHKKYPSLPDNNIKIEGNSVLLTMESGITVEFPYIESKSKSTVYRNKTMNKRNKRREHHSVLLSASSLRRHNANANATRKELNRMRRNALSKRLDMKRAEVAEKLSREQALGKDMTKIIDLLGSISGIGSVINRNGSHMAREAADNGGAAGGAGASAHKPLIAQAAFVFPASKSAKSAAPTLEKALKSVPEPVLNAILKAENEDDLVSRLSTLKL